MVMFNSLPPSFRNILIIKPGAVGDLLQMTPVLRALRRNSPEVMITMLVGSRTTASLFANNPHVTETVVFDRSGQHRSLAAQISLWRTLRKRRFDLLLNFQRSNLKTWFLASAALPCRVLVYHKTADRTVHAVRNYLTTIAPLGITSEDMDLELFLDIPSRDFAQDLFSAQGLEGSSVVALNPGATHEVNRWPVEHFAKLADLLSEQHLGKAVIIGGPDDVPLAGELIALSRSKPLSLAGKTSLLQLAAVLEKCRAVVSGDTGPLHLATAVGTKVIALFGAADPARTGPVGRDHRIIRASGVNCVPCRSRTCGNPVYLECMNKITAEEVAGAVAGLMIGR